MKQKFMPPDPSILALLIKEYLCDQTTLEILLFSTVYCNIRKIIQTQYNNQ